MLKRFLRSAPVQAAAARTAARYMLFVIRTTRWRIEGEAQLREFASGPPCLVVFWHETLLTIPAVFLTARRFGLRRRAVVLASRHQDGRLIGAAMVAIGVDIVAGSSSRGAAAGLRALLKALKEGAHAGLTPDGPRGPRRTAAAGVVWLAAQAAVPVLPCATYVTRAWTFKSWDRMRLPLPFGRGALVCGAPIPVPRDPPPETLPALQAALIAVTARAEAIA